MSGLLFVFFFEQKTAYGLRISDWSSDVCSSDLAVALASAALASSPAAAQNRQQKAQAAGDYGTINDSYMDPVGAIQNAWNNPGANKAPNQETPGYNRIEYRPDRVIRSEEHTSELQSLMRISYAVFCLKKKKKE